MYTVDNFVLGLQKIWPNLSITQECDHIKMVQQVYRSLDQQTADNETIGVIPIAELEVAIGNIPHGLNVKEFFVYSDGYCEVFVHPDRSRGPVHRNIDHEYYSTNSNNYTFSISKASVSYTVLLICACAVSNDINIEALVPPRPYFHREYLDSLEGLMQSFRWMTIKVTAPLKTSISEFKKMAHSYLFNICYNTSFIFAIPESHSDRRPLRRATRRDGQLFPYKQYNQSLVKYYYQALSSDIPFAQYLALYHVPEYFFPSCCRRWCIQGD